MRIEWAAIEMHSRVGGYDGYLTTQCVMGAVDTVRCFLIYPKAAQAVTIAAARKNIRTAFNGIREAHRWPWLKLLIEEQPVGD